MMKLAILVEDGEMMEHLHLFHQRQEGEVLILTLMGLEELRHGLVPPSREAQQRDLRLAERKTELERLADRGVVKKRRSKEGRFRPVLPDTSPPTPIRDDFWPPPPVQPSDKSLIKPEAFDTKRPLRDDFPRPLTKIIDSKKNKIEVILKKNRH